MSATTLKHLPGEEGRNEFRQNNQRFNLTNQRLIFVGESKRLLVLPGGQVLAAAMLRDVDAVFLGRRYVLPTWVGLLGVVAALGSLSAESGVGFVIGVALAAAWYFLGATVLEFRVDGDPLGAVSMVSAGEIDQELASARAFVEAFFEAKANAGRSV